MPHSRGDSPPTAASLPHHHAPSLEVAELGIAMLNAPEWPEGVPQAGVGPGMPEVVREAAAGRGTQSGDQITKPGAENFLEPKEMVDCPCLYFFELLS